MDKTYTLFHKKCIVLPLFFLFYNFSHAQVSGIINNYYKVTAVSDSILTLSSLAGLNVGDNALIIQMQGAEIDTSNTKTFGTITNYKEAGNYEFVRIKTLLPLMNQVIISASLSKNYNVAGNVQLVRVPHYIHARVSATLSCMPWNGNTGGVLVFSADTVTLNADIDVSGRGFRGGAAVPVGGVSCNPYRYREPASNIHSGNKGEGIHILSPLYSKSVNAPANGGGGGGDSEASGAGGGNLGAGGNGDYSSPTGCCPSPGSTCCCPSDTLPAFGGKGLSYSNALNKIFMGGGGGGAPNPEYANPGGAPGGGIVIIRAGLFYGNTNSIISKGNIRFGGGDGSGGGGAGGTVLLDINYLCSGLDVDVSGGDGWTSNLPSASGGGGGGVIWLADPAVPPLMTLSFGGGLRGVPRAGASWFVPIGATSGTAGGSLLNLVMPNRTLLPVISVSGCPGSAVPIALLKFKGEVTEDYNILYWSVAADVQVKSYIIERSAENEIFTEIGQIKSEGQTQFFFVDKTVPEMKICYYRLKQVYLNGNIAYSNELMLPAHKVKRKLLVLPNLVEEGKAFRIKTYNPENETVKIEITDIQGKIHYRESFQLNEGNNDVLIDKENFRKGIYYIKMESQSFNEIKKLIVF